MRIWIRILVRLYRRFKFNSYIKYGTGNIFYVGSGNVIKHTYVGTKAFLKGWISGLLVNFFKFLFSLSGYAFSMHVPHPGEPNQC
jgi:hypothetical protein